MLPAWLTFLPGQDWATTGLGLTNVLTVGQCTYLWVLRRPGLGSPGGKEDRQRVRRRGCWGRMVQ